MLSYKENYDKTCCKHKKQKCQIKNIVTHKFILKKQQSLKNSIFSINDLMLLLNLLFCQSRQM